MTNEQLVNEIQRGNVEYIPQLWNQVVHYIWWYAEKYLSNYPEHIQALLEDCVQQSYFAMLAAIRGYDPQYGKFTTYMKHGLITSFREVIYSGRGEKKESDPLNTAASLDELLTMSDGTEATLADFTADKEAGVQTCFAIPRGVAMIDDLDQWRSVNKWLRSALTRTENDGNRLLLYMLDHDCKYSEAVKALYGSDTNALQWQKKAAMSRLKRLIVSKPKEVEKYGIEEIATQGGFAQYSLKSYKNRIFTSAVEQIAIDRASKLK